MSPLETTISWQLFAWKKIVPFLKVDPPSPADWGAIMIIFMNPKFIGAYSNKIFVVVVVDWLTFFQKQKLA